jgi:hypothetical protein
MADARGGDAETGLAVTVDVTGWVVDVEVPERATALRTADGLEAALRRAIGSALLQHLLDNAEHKVLGHEERRRAADLLGGRATLTPRRVEPSPPVERPREPVSPPSYHSDERWRRRWTGTSRDGEVSVAMSAIAGLERLEADDEFLRTCSSQMLRHALREAFREADRACGEELSR